MWAMRADRGSKMLAATVQVGREITWRNRSRACDIMCPPFPLGSCPQSNLTPDLFSRDLHSAFFAQPPSYRARDEHGFACDPFFPHAVRRDNRSGAIVRSETSCNVCGDCAIRYSTTSA